MIQVSIIEDHRSFREGLSFLLQESEGYICLACFDNAVEAVQELSGEEDVILLDVNLPKMSGVEAIPLFKEKFPDLKIIMLTICDDDTTIMQAILSGADGYLLKKTPPNRILSSLQEAIEGGSPMTPSIAGSVLTLFKKYIPKKNDSFSLTQREIEILKLIVNGESNRAIGESLFISVETVRNHIRHIYKKLQVHSKSQAVVKAIREGLV